MMMIETSPCSLSSRDQVEDQRAFLGAHRGERLVEQQDLRVGVDRAGHRDRLPLAAGQLGDVGASTDGMATPISSRCSRASRFIVRLYSSGPATFSRLRNMLWYTRAALTSARSWYTASMPSDRAWSTDSQAHLLAVEQDPARGRRLEAAQDLEQGGLARAVVADAGRAPRPWPRCRLTSVSAVTAP